MLCPTFGAQFKYELNWHTLAKNRMLFCQGVISFLKRDIGACKYASKRLKAGCASYTQRARAVCFVPVMQKMQINRDFPLYPTFA